MRIVARDVVAESDRRHRDEAIVDRVQEVPVALQDGEDRRREEEDEDDDERQKDEDVDEADVEGAVEVAAAGHESGENFRRDDHETFDDGSEEDEHQRYSDGGVDDAEDLSALGRRCHVTVT